MIRMEIACFLVVAFLSIMYFSARREKTKLHRVFSVFLIMSMLHLVFDGATIYTVNRLDSVPSWVNDVLHRLYIGTMNMVFYYIGRYISTLIETDTDKKPHITIYSTIVLVVGLIATLFLPITYIETEHGNYAYGAVAYMLYVSLAIYIILVVVILCKYWKLVHPKKRQAITIAMIIQVIAFLCQAVYPLALISGMGIMLVTLSFYLTMENPDILLIHQVQAEKRKADEANAAKTIFLSNMSHEIRTPMNAIVGMTEILLRTNLSEEQREYLMNIKNSGNALVSIINDILDVSKIEAGKLELVEDVYEIRPLLKDIHMMIENRIGDKPVKLIYEIDEHLPYKLYGDAVRIRQIIINLLNNAVKFTDNGYVKLVLKADLNIKNECMLYISVSDSGQGIRAEDLERLFGAFEQADKKKNAGKEGTGLGLSISARLVEMMGGKLEVRSEYGVGSEFFFTISQSIICEEGQVQSETDADTMDFTAPDARVLIVDDNSMNCKVAKGLLSPLQMQIDIADDGKKAIDMIRKNKYDLVLMDHMMPVMDGVEATRYIRAMEGTYYRELPIIALSANAMKEVEKLFTDAGMNDFVAKPIDVRQMYKVILKWLPENLISRQTNLFIAETDRNVLKRAEEIYDIEGINAKKGIENSGSEELFISLLGDFYKLIDMKSVKLEKCIADNMLKDFTIEVHALKNTARMIGAMELSEEFRNLEQLGNDNDMNAIQAVAPKVITLYRKYKQILKPYGDKQETEKKVVPVEEMTLYLKGMQEAIEGFDLDMVDEAMKRLEEVQMPEQCQDFMDNLRVFVADVAMEDILQMTEEMIILLNER